MNALEHTTAIRPAAAVIGGGILGTLTALNLSRAGLDCDIIERRPGLWEGATFAGEGKIHLGYVYGLADDDTLTSLLIAASDFARELEQAIGHPLPWTGLVSRAFEYGIPSTSLITTDEFRAHAHRLRCLAENTVGGESLGYLGVDLAHPRLEVATGADHRRFVTPERSVDMVRLRDTVVGRVLDDPRISLRCSTEVEHATRTGDTWLLESRSTDSGHARTDAYDFVVNCAWESTILLDRRAGVDRASVPNLRLRRFVHALSDSPPTALTLTLGPFGDFVSFADGRAYASWYPTGLRGFATSVAPPEEWAAEPSDDDDPEYVSSLVSALAEWIPGIADMRDATVHSRIVVATGSTDIDDPGSELHLRRGPAILAKDSWLSVRSFKLSTAPTAARLVRDEIMGMLS